MAHSFDRRRLGAAFLALGLCASTAASAADASGLEGTWGGAKGEVTAQVIIAGGSVIGYFWRDDYLDTSSATFSADGRSVSFAFQGGGATLTRTGERTATLEVREGSRVTRLDLKRD